MKYIRFFISSTFTDMERERNILNEVLTSLRDRYAAQGWIIEWIDLRWGISREASLDNRTMRICIEELRRCQRMSPRPNFIILMGERYGWIPLPEVIPAEDIDTEAISRLDDFSRKLFIQWYRLDTNALPRGQYILQPRQDTFADEFIYNTLVVGPLRQILKEITHGQTSETITLSATAQEIMEGLNADSSSHTMVYRRTLTGIPESVLKQFQEGPGEGRQRLNKLYRMLTQLENAECTLPISGNFQRYTSGAMDQEIGKRMRETLSRIIEKVIATRRNETEARENEQHMIVAFTHHGELAGRDDVLAKLSSYLSSAERKPLIITAESGTGKSAVMRELVNRLMKLDSNSEGIESIPHRLVVRFCGDTPEASEAWQFMDSVVNDLWINTISHQKELSRGNRIRRIRIKRPGETIWSNAIEPSGLLLGSYSEPTILIIDAIDRVDDSECKGFFDFGWLDRELPINLKVIVTTTPDKIEGLSLRHAIIDELPPMGKDAIDMVRHLLNLQRRTLTNSQWNIIANKIEASDKSGIYLKVLADHLATVTSYDPYLEMLPTDLDGLLDHMLKQLRTPSRHGSNIVDLSLSSIASTRLGLSDTEIRGILADDPMVAEEVAATSQHCMAEGSPAVPPIFWARLKADLQNLLTQRYTRVGLLNTFSHQRIADYIRRRLLPDHYSRGVGNITVANYFGRHFSPDYLHALYERARLLRRAMTDFMAMDRENSDRAAQATADLVFETLTHLLINNFDYIFNKLIYFRDDHIADYNRTLSSIQPSDISHKLSQVRNEVMIIPAADKNAMLTWVLNMPDSSLIKQEPLKSNRNLKLLHNRWRNLSPSRSLIHPIDEIGEQTHLSADGDAVAYLKDNGLTFVVKPLNHSDKSRFLTLHLTTPILKLISDCNLNRHLLISAERINIYDCHEGRIIKAWKNSPDYQTFMSDDGEIVVIVYDGGFIVHDVVADHSETYDNTLNPTDSRLSPSGRYLWSMYQHEGETQVERLDLATMQSNWVGEGGAIMFADEELVVVKKPGLEGYNQEYYVKYLYACDGATRYHSIALDFEAPDDTLFWFSTTENALYLQNHKRMMAIPFEVTNNKVVTNIFGITPRLLTVNGNYAIRCNPLSVVRWREMANELYVPQAWNVGLNSFSATTDGLQAAMGVGINPMQEEHPRILLINPKGAFLFVLPFTTAPSLTTSVAISPDGRYIAACSSSGEIIIVKNGPEMELVTSFQAEHSCLGLQFSADSRKLLAVCDHFIESPTPTMYLADVDSGVIEKLPGQLDWEDKRYALLAPWPQGSSRLTRDGRFAILGDFIWDIEEQRQVLPFDWQVHPDRLYPRDFHGESSLPPVSGIFEHPHGQLLASFKGNLLVINPFDRKVTTIPEPKTIAGISCDGSIYFFIDSDHKLYAQFGSTQRHFANGIMTIYPSLSAPRLLYAYTADQYIIELDIEGHELARAYLPDLWHAIPTLNGLAVASHRGIMLFSR